MTEAMIKELTIYVWQLHKDWSLEKAEKYVRDNYVLNNIKGRDW